MLRDRARWIGPPSVFSFTLVRVTSPARICTNSPVLTARRLCSGFTTFRSNHAQKERDTVVTPSPPHEVRRLGPSYLLRICCLIRISSTTRVTYLCDGSQEGIAVFLSTLADPRVGLALGVAIAMHNIPEGIAVGFISASILSPSRLYFSFLACTSAAPRLHPSCASAVNDCVSAANL